MAAPASAWTVHEIAHGATKVGVDDHHHHEKGGEISVHEHDEGDVPDGGHDHMPSIVHGAATLPDSDAAVVALSIQQSRFAYFDTQEIGSSSPDGLKRPPRLG